MSVRLTFEDIPRVYLDTTVFVIFGQSGELIPLLSRLAGRARIVNEVDHEILRNSLKSEFSFLKVLGLIKNWPPAPPIELTAEQMTEVLSIKNAVKRPGDHPLKDLGEIATVIAAQADGGVPVASDDGLAAKLCWVRGIRRITSVELSKLLED